MWDGSIPRMFENEETLRPAVEKASRRPLTEDEWAAVRPNWEGPYDDADVTELAKAAQGVLSKRILPTSEESAFKHRRGYQDRAAQRLRPLVEASREELFGNKAPPFTDVDDVTGPAEWIESYAESTSSQYLSLNTVSVPASLKPMEVLAWLTSTLTRELNQNQASDNRDASETVKRFVDESDVVEQIRFMKPPELEYLALNADGERYVKSVQAPNGSILNRLRLAAAQIATALDWKPYSALHHLFTGGVPDHPLVLATSQDHWLGRARRVTSKIRIEILDPNSVTEQQIAKAYREVRAKNASLPGGRERQRSRPPSKSERVGAFVAETPRMPWDKRLDEWNRRNPSERFLSQSAMKKAYSRAKNR